MTQLSEHVRYRIGGKATHVGAARCDELTRLVIIHWPHRHLRAAMRGSRPQKEIDHALLLLRAQVRERWEARHGIGPAWAMLMAPAVTAIAHVLLDLWGSDPEWADRILDMGLELRTGGKA